MRLIVTLGLLLLVLGCGAEKKEAAPQSTDAATDSIVSADSL